MHKYLIGGLILAFICTGCQPIAATQSARQPAASPIVPSSMAISVEEIPLPKREGDPCSGAFITHPLDHLTNAPGDTIHMFESNGSGLALNDLDDDGDIDIALGNLTGDDTILWNEGGLSFRTERLPDANTRAVSSVDVDGDGWLDIVLARRNQLRPAFWRNRGDGVTPRFVLTDLPVRNPYTMAWADLDGDGDLDLVTATYDAELGKVTDNNRPLGSGGVIYYENQNGVFQPTHLALEDQALALLLADVNNDRHLDILVGNDFLLADQAWLWQPTGWQAATPFAVTPQNTMSLDAADIDNDGDSEFFAADMMPYADDPATKAAWEPLMANMHDHETMMDDSQVMENVLLTRQQDGSFANRGESSGVAASGWSWSSKFGDLDNDGFLDLYVVNGMIAQEMFSHLPNNELVEENQIFRNDGQGNFVRTPDWQLNSKASGRSMSMADLDNDGDLDIVVNNLQSPAQLFENRLCTGNGLEVDLFWSKSKNSRAIGAQLILHTETASLRREVRSTSGYLSGDPARVHFGFPAESRLEQLEIHWPDGEISLLDAPSSQMLLRVTR